MQVQHVFGRWDPFWGGGLLLLCAGLGAVVCSRFGVDGWAALPAVYLVILFGPLVGATWPEISGSRRKNLADWIVSSPVNRGVTRLWILVACYALAFVGFAFWDGYSLLASAPLFVPLVILASRRPECSKE